MNNEPDDRVPFYVLPYVGGSHTLRSVAEFRFIDENSLFMNLEYRWKVVKNMTLFAEEVIPKLRPQSRRAPGGGEVKVAAAAGRV